MIGYLLDTIKSFGSESFILQMEITMLQVMEKRLPVHTSCDTQKKLYAGVKKKFPCLRSNISCRPTCSLAWCAQAHTHKGRLSSDKSSIREVPSDSENSYSATFPSNMKRTLSDSLCYPRNQWIELNISCSENDDFNPVAAEERQATPSRDIQHIVFTPPSAFGLAQTAANLPSAVLEPI
ncbi:hypothetical protein AKJ16_DCAP09172 [Drosera capensis]